MKTIKIWFSHPMQRRQLLTGVSGLLILTALAVDYLTGSASLWSGLMIMAALIAGRAGGLTPGVHIDGNERHPAQVVITAMQALGGPDELGEVSGAIQELLS